MIQRLFRLACLSLGLLALPAGAMADVLAPYDQLFLRSEARSNAYELALARLASKRASQPAVKSYADTLAQDHEERETALRALAAKKGMTVNMGVSAQSKTALNRLGQSNGRAFDRAFLAEAGRVNGAAMRAFRVEASRTSDPELKTYVADGLAIDARHDAALAALTPKPDGMPIIRPPVTGNMPVLPPPAAGTTPVIPPPR